MLPEGNVELTKEKIDFFLKEVAKEYRKRVGKKSPAELILVGGASVLINYGFRNMTTDIDAITLAASTFKEAVNAVRDRYDLADDWLNSDFKKTDSYTPRLREYSVYYKTFSNVLTIRTVAAEYLIAMKVKAGRKYKNDLSDIIGILAEHEKQGNDISLERILEAFAQLYGENTLISEDIRKYLQDVFTKGSFSEQYARIRNAEKQARSQLIDFVRNNPDEVKTMRAEEILQQLKKKKQEKRQG